LVGEMSTLVSGIALTQNIGRGTCDTRSPPKGLVHRLG
jgi:hypothetical protein